MTRVIVVGHADADGHVITEQVRRNLATISTFTVTTVVDVSRTRDHNAWLNLRELVEVDASDLVFFVDLMFSPASYASEANALVAFVNARPQTRFYLVDHHPLPLRLLSRAPNLRVAYRRDVVDCTFGRPSWMMSVAALLEPQPSRAKRQRHPTVGLIAKGMQRAAAPGGPLPGEKLLALLSHNRWSEIEALGREDASYHKLHRGFRARGSEISETLKRLDRAAGKLLGSDPVQSPKDKAPMAYDFDVETATVSPKKVIKPAASSDLEAIVMLLELAAMDLAVTPETTFSFDELLDQARDIGGRDIDLNEDDVQNVLGKANFLKKEPGKKFRLK